jgi:hypothetical protein
VPPGRLCNGTTVVAKDERDEGGAAPPSGAAGGETQLRRQCVVSAVAWDPDELERDALGRALVAVLSAQCGALKYVG